MPPYERCVAIRCMNPGTKVVDGVVLCPEHTSAIVTALTPEPVVIRPDPIVVQAEPIVVQAPAPPPPPFDPWREAVVYYVVWRHRNVVKIGTTTNLKMRLRALGGMRQPAFLTAVEPGSYYLERKRHAEFAAQRENGEEFRWCQRIADHIAATRERVQWTPPGGWPYSLRLEKTK